MSILFNKSRNLKFGFTLIELLVVIAIIGVLASIVLASLNTARRKSRDARRISDIKQIQLALELCFDSGNDCATNTSTEYPNEDAGAGGGEVPAALVTDGFLPVMPKDPSTDGLYAYVNLADSSGTACDAAADTCTYYQLGAVLEDAANTALDSDRDIAGLAGGLAGNGDVDCYTASVGGADICYDVAP